MTLNAIGRPIVRMDAKGKVTGETLYPGDMTMEGMLHMKILFADRPHARVVSIDTSEAEALPGVHGIFTAQDVPTNEYGLIINDQPVLCGPGSEKPGTDIVRTIMDQVAVIVADTEAIAAEARDLIRVEYEDLPAVFDPLEAMEDDAPQLHHDHPNNIVAHNKVRRGDLDAAFEKADVIIEQTYTTSWQEHAYLQPEAGLAYYDEQGRITVEVAGQWTHEDQEQIAHALNLPLDQIRVIYPAIGGAFGGREDMSVQIVLALAVMNLKRPIKIIWTREESMIGHHKRHPYHIEQKWGATNDGRIIAMQSRVISDSGAYCYTSNKVLGNATLMVTGPYHVENVHVDAYTVYTNNVASGAFRGFGGPQAAFAAEMQINKLAEALDMDPVALRMKNILTDDTPLHVGTLMPPNVTLDKTLIEAATHHGWQQSGDDWQAPTVNAPTAPHKRRGIGVACGFKNIGFSFGFPERCDATIELRGTTEIDEAIIYHAGADVGQGAHTVFLQMTADALGVPLDRVRIEASDTASSGTSGSASASRMTFMAGNAIRGAAELALEAWQNEDRPAIGDYTYNPPATTMFDPDTGECMPNFAYGYVAETAEVEVDIETGLIEVRRVICANDVGKAINPQQIEGQIEGAVVQAHGYTIMEHFQMKDGYVTTPFFSNYLIPGVLDIPDKVDSLILEYADTEGPWGVRGMAEMPFIPLAPAITHALHNATGVWFDDLPLTPDRVVAALRAAGIGG